jgi:Flp pilus assembly protein TadG
MIRSRIRQLAREESGQDLVELTIVTPVLLLVLLAIIEFGGLIDSQQELSYLTREGASIASRGTAIDTVLAITLQNGQDIGLSSRGGAVVSRVTMSGGAAEVSAQVASPGYASASRMGAAGDQVGSIEDLALADGTSVHVVEVFLERPTSTPLLNFFSGSIPEVMYDRAIF